MPVLRRPQRLVEQGEGQRACEERIATDRVEAVMTGALDLVLGYIERGWQVITVKRGDKRPPNSAWQTLRLTADDVRHRFNGGEHPNVGIVLGSGSGGLTDVDLDAPEAIAVAGYFLPTTGMIFGRASKRMAHRIYITPLAQQAGRAAIRYEDPETPGKPLLELRIGGARAAQTVFPPSIHESGEPVAFEPGCCGEPATVDGDTLTRAAELTAAAALIARVWPHEGGHKPAQVLGGFLARAGLPASHVQLFAEAVLHRIGGVHARDHARTARNAAEAFEYGRNAYGFPELAQTFGERRAGAIAKWLRYNEAPRARPKPRPNGASNQGADAGDESLLTELAGLSRFAYDRRRKHAAEQLGIKVGTLDRAVAEKRAGDADDNANPPHWNVEPWLDPVDGAALLDTIADTFRRHVVLPTHAPEALALWTVHTWAVDCAACTPFMALISPVPRCGKTTVMILLKWLTPRSELAGNISAAALFRYIERERPTLLIDEGDTFLADDETLRGILNAGHTRAGAYVIRCEGESMTPRRFSTWSPKAIATIAKLAPTLKDRSIIVMTKRKTPFERVERLRGDDSHEFAALRRKLLRWTEDNAEGLKRSDPDIPGGLDDRAADNWRPLLAIADAAGGNWPREARVAATALSGGRDEDTTLVRLLSDIRDIFDETRSEWFTSTVLADRLAAIDGAPWADWRRGRPISSTAVTHMLKPCQIAPDRKKGAGKYWRDQFEDAWKRLVPAPWEPMRGSAAGIGGKGESLLSKCGEPNQPPNSEAQKSQLESADAALPHFQLPGVT